MERVEKVFKMKDEQFKRILGVNKDTFRKMYTALSIAHTIQHQDGGSPCDLSVGDKLIITLQYWREYRTYEHIAVDYCVDKSTVCRSVKWTEDVLAASGIFDLPGEKVLASDKMNGEEIVVDVTEHPIERPKKQQSEHYSGKKKAHD